MADENHDHILPLLLLLPCIYVGPRDDEDTPMIRESIPALLEPAVFTVVLVPVSAARRRSWGLRHNGKFINCIEGTKSEVIAVIA